jgi:biofilm PGA synthesis N-glycosyltransferase PgaC
MGPPKAGEMLTLLLGIGAALVLASVGYTMMLLLRHRRNAVPRFQRSSSEDSSGMHRSYIAPVNGSYSRRYLGVATKFYLSLGFAGLWMGVSAWISWPWVRSLSVLIGLAPAWCVVSLLALIPGFIVAFLVAGITMDRQPPFTDPKPKDELTVLIAARNEEAAIAETITSLAEQDYVGPLRVILIDNGSCDATSAVARTAANRCGLSLLVLYEERPGKSHALNTGLGYVTTELVVTLDADTVLQCSALRLLVARWHSGPAEVRAVAGAVLVRNTRSSLWSRLQTWDYFLGIASVKRMQGLFQSTLVAQGAFSLYVSEAVRAAGGWPDAIGEDIVLTWEMMSSGALIYFEPLAVAFTSAPETLSVLGRQRSRWARGMIEGLRSVPPWHQQHKYARLLAGFDLLIPLLDATYVVLWLPGLVLACFGIYWFVGPMTVAVLPLTLAVYVLLYHYQNRRVFAPLGLTVRRDRIGLFLFVITYQAFMSVFSLRGYLQEMTGRARHWS